MKGSGLACAGTAYPEVSTSTRVCKCLCLYVCVRVSNGRKCCYCLMYYKHFKKEKLISILFLLFSKQKSNSQKNRLMDQMGTLMTRLEVAEI